MDNFSHDFTRTYLLQCCRYVELNPVKAKIVHKPEHYSWSSYRARIGVIRNNWLDSDQSFLGLSSTRSERGKRYRDFVETSRRDVSTKKINNYINSDYGSLPPYGRMGMTMNLQTFYIHIIGTKCCIKVPRLIKPGM